MAVIARLSNKALLSARNFNEQSKAIIGTTQLITPLNIDGYDDTSIQISDTHVSGHYSTIYIESADIGFEAGMIEPLYLVVEDGPGTTLRENIETFNDNTKTDVVSTGSATKGLSHNGGPSDSFDERLAPVYLSFDKITGTTEGGIKIDRVVDISRHSGIFVEMNIPESATGYATGVKIRITEPGISTYSEYDFTPTKDVYGVYFADFLNPSLAVGTPQYETALSIDVLITTDLITEGHSGIMLANVYGALKDVNAGITDNKIKIMVTEDGENGIVMATRMGGSWLATEAIDIKGLSEDLASHFLNDNMHIPESSVAALRQAYASAGNELITLDDIDRVTMDSKTLSRASVRSIIESSINNQRDKQKLNSAISIFGESVQRGLSGLNVEGSCGYIDTTSGVTDAIKRDGYYQGSTVTTNILTRELINTPFNARDILVDMAITPASAYSSIRYSLNMNGVDVMSDLLLGEEYSLDQMYIDFALSGTIPKLNFYIPGFPDESYYLSVETPLGADVGNKIATSGDGTMICVSGDSSRIRSSKSQSAWSDFTPPPENIGDNHSFVGSVSGGARIFSPSTGRGYRSNISNGSWSFSPGHVGSGGVTETMPGGYHYILESDAMYRFDEASEVSVLLNSPFTGLSGGGIAHSDGTILATDGSDTHAYNEASGTWQPKTSPAVDSSEFALLGSKSGKINKFGGGIVGSASFDTNLETWSAIDDLPFAATNPFFGSTSNGNAFISDPSLTEGAHEYIENEQVKVYGFGVKFGFGKITGDADHVGYWVEDGFPSFVQCTQEQADEAGFWTDDDGTMFGAIGTHWGFFGIWASDTHPDFEDATFDERWQSGFWADDNDQIVVGEEVFDSSLWDVEDPES